MEILLRHADTACPFARGETSHASGDDGIYQIFLDLVLRICTSHYEGYEELGVQVSERPSLWL